MCCDKIRCIQEKVLSLLRKSTDRNTTLSTIQSLSYRVKTLMSIPIHTTSYILQKVPHITLTHDPRNSPHMTINSWPQSSCDFKHVPLVVMCSCHMLHDYAIQTNLLVITNCYNEYFFSTDLALFLSASYLIATHDNLITRYAIFYLFSHEISISLMLSQPSFNFCAVHGYAFFSSLPFWYLIHHTCLCFHSMHSPFNFCTHSPRLRVFPYEYSIGRSHTIMYKQYE